jgi:CopG family transcriptional regulator, nickel-responsive regulator
MKTDLVRFGVAMDKPLLEHLDVLVNERRVTRSELLRDLVRAEVVKAQVERGVPAFAALTLVYDHHVRDLTEKLTDVQHELGDRVRSTLHVHLDHHRCLEVIVLRGRSDELQRIAERLLATRGVKHGGIEIVTDIEEEGGSEPHAHPNKRGPGAPPGTRASFDGVQRHRPRRALRARKTL